MRRTWSISLAAAALGLLALPITASALPPANDDYGSAAAITTNSQLAGNNTEATLQSGENDFGGDGGASVWYTWTADFSGPVQIHTCNGPDLDTILGVYTASGLVPPFTNLSLVASNDDFCGPNFVNSTVQFNAANGTIYKIQVLGFVGMSGPEEGPFVVRVSNQLPAVTIDSGPGSTTSPNPSWTFHSSIGGSTFECAIFRGNTGLVDQFCSSPFASPMSLSPGNNYEFDVLAETPTGEFGVNFRTFTVQSAGGGSAPPATGTLTGLRANALKKCKKKHTARARRKCRKRARALPLSTASRLR